MVEEAPEEEEEDEPRVTNFNIPIKEIEKRFRALIRSLDVLLVRDCDHRHLGGFLGEVIMMMMMTTTMMMMILVEVVDEFRQESKLKRMKEGDEVEVTLQDRLMFVRQVVIISTSYILYIYFISTLYRWTMVTSAGKYTKCGRDGAGRWAWTLSW